MNKQLTELAVRYGRSLIQQVTGVNCGITEPATTWASWTTPALFAPATSAPLPLRALWTMVQGKSPRQATLALVPLQPLDLQQVEGNWLQNPVKPGEDFARSAMLGTAFVQHGGVEELDFERFYGLMQKYASSLPCTYGESGVSLFRQWAMVAAIMALAQGDTPATLPQDLALIGLDLPGIQETVYTITSRGAGKSVRGRSAFIQLLVNALVDRIVHDLGLCRANVIVNAGGNALILASHSAQLESYLQDLDRAINELLLYGNDARAFAGFQGDLAFALASIKLPWSALTYPCETVQDGEKRTSQWQFYEKEVKEKLQQAKLRPFAALLDDPRGFTQLFQREAIDSSRCCAVCRRPESKAIVEFEAWDEEVDENPGAAQIVCSMCKSFRALADSLGKQGIYLNRFSQAPRRAPEVWQQALHAISNYWYALSDQPLADAFCVALSPDRFPASGVHGCWPLSTTTPLVNQQDVEAARKRGDSQVQIGHIRDNVMLAEDSPGTFKRLGVLKADVDDLGKILVDGLRDKRSAALTATLSESLTLFFGGWLDKICAQEPYCNKVYVLYAGGDDLLIIGAWDRIPQLAARIAQDFALYTGKNPGVHLSAGISLVGGKEPLYAAIESANKALKQAKQYPQPHDATKNALSFIGKVLEWPEFASVQSWQKELIALVAQGAPKSLLTMLIQIYQQYQDDRKIDAERVSGYATRAKLGRYEGHTLYLGPWLWQMIYRLSRLSNPILTQEKVQEIQQALLATQGENSSGGVDKMAVSARWAQLVSRASQE